MTAPKTKVKTKKSLAINIEKLEFIENVDEQEYQPLFTGVDFSQTSVNNIQILHPNINEGNIVKNLPITPGGTKQFNAIIDEEFDPSPDVLAQARRVLVRTGVDRRHEVQLVPELASNLAGPAAGTEFRIQQHRDICHLRHPLSF